MFIFLLDRYISQRRNSGSFRRDYLARNLVLFLSSPLPSSVGDGSFGSLGLDGASQNIDLAGIFLILPSTGAAPLLSGSETVLEFHTIFCFKNKFYSLKKMSLETDAFC